LSFLEGVQIVDEIFKVPDLNLEFFVRLFQILVVIDRALKGSDIAETG
jgi:hypothetical protein